jgi:hypothetical protein
VFITFARGLILLLRIPLLMLIGAGAVVICAASRADDWLTALRPSLTSTELAVVVLAGRQQRDGRRSGWRSVASDGAAPRLKSVSDRAPAIKCR